MKKIVSIALFGEAAPDYARYLRAFVRGHLNLFPLAEGWQLRVHVDSAAASSSAGALIRAYAREGLCESVIMYTATKATPPLCKAMLWRVDPAFDPKVEYVFARDLDSPPMPRDRACCEWFIRSKATVHTIHDSEQHTGVMGGLCGFWAPEFRKQTGFQRLEDLYEFAGFTTEQWKIKGADQIALNRLLDERQHLILLEHRYAGWKKGPGVLPERQPGMYSCDAHSTRVPISGADFLKNDALLGKQSSWKTSALADAADRIGAHLGCAGYDVERAVEFWDSFGDPGVAEAVRQAEVKL